MEQPTYRDKYQEMRKKVLIVEDNELNMKLFHDLLEAYDIDTIQTREGKLAYDMAMEHKPDLIIMDIQLPEISGLDITKQLKQNDELKNIPVIAVTAFAMKGDEQKIREGGCEDYISKPISVSRFIEVVRKHLDSSTDGNIESDTALQVEITNPDEETSPKKEIS